MCSRVFAVATFAKSSSSNGDTSSFPTAVVVCCSTVGGALLIGHFVCKNNTHTAWTNFAIKNLSLTCSKFYAFRTKWLRRRRKGKDQGDTLEADRDKHFIFMHKSFVFRHIFTYHYIFKTCFFCSSPRWEYTLFASKGVDYSRQALSLSHVISFWICFLSFFFSRVFDSDCAVSCRELCCLPTSLCRSVYEEKRCSHAFPLSFVSKYIHSSNPLQII